MLSPQASRREVIDVPMIKPVSKLRNYPSVLKDVEGDQVVYLTKNGHGKYAVSDITYLEQLQAVEKLYNELMEGLRSGNEEGWFTHEEVLASLGIEDG